MVAEKGSITLCYKRMNRITEGFLYGHETDENFGINSIPSKYKASIADNDTDIGGPSGGLGNSSVLLPSFTLQLKVLFGVCCFYMFVQISCVATYIAFVHISQVAVSLSVAVNTTNTTKQHYFSFLPSH